MSIGLIDLSETAFSASGNIILKFTGHFTDIKAYPIPKTTALPPISFFMSSILLEGFISNPPLSNVTPLPINTIVGTSFFVLFHLISIRAGLFSEDLPTKLINGKFVSNFFPSKIVILAPKGFKEVFIISVYFLGVK